MASDPKKALEAQRRIQAGTLDGPRLLVAGPALEGPPSEADYNTWIVHGPEEASKMVAKLVDLRVDFIKVHDHLSRETYRAVADSASVDGRIAMRRAIETLLDDFERGTSLLRVGTHPIAKGAGLYATKDWLGLLRFRTL